jgi:purine-nucleoside phosphorylase
LRSRQIPFLKGLTWSTDVPYRETQNIIEKRKKVGCIVVDMEAAGMIAVAQFRKVSFGQIMYAGDDLSGAEWDNRKWSSRKGVRENLFWTSADAVLLL